MSFVRKVVMYSPIENPTATVIMREERVPPFKRGEVVEWGRNGNIEYTGKVVRRLRLRSGEIKLWIEPRLVRAVIDI